MVWGDQGGGEVATGRGVAPGGKWGPAKVISIRVKTSQPSVDLADVQVVSAPKGMKGLEVSVRHQVLSGETETFSFRRP